MANELREIIINGQSFDLYTDIFSLDTMTWTEEPTRSLDGSMPDINTIDRFPVPRVWLDFGYITIADYRRLLTAVSIAEFTVSYYNLETDSVVSYKMYVHPLDRYKIYNKGINLIGITGVGITLIGTLNSVDTYSITYNGNGASSGAVSSQTGYYGQTIQLNDKGTLINSNKTLNSWNTAANGLGSKYMAGQNIVLTGSITLYAQWQTSEIYTLSFDYQGATSGVETINKTVTYSAVVGTLPTPLRTGYIFGGWYDLMNGVGNLYTSAKIYSVRGNITLYVKWTVA